jgi:hypothetical protein
MKALIVATTFLLAFTASSAAMAKTVSGTINENALVVPGNTVCAYLVADQIVTTLQDSEMSHPSELYGLLPVLQISFEMEPYSYLVKHVTWSKTNRKLTIDF